jgi:hypothetical protein
MLAAIAVVRLVTADPAGALAQQQAVAVQLPTFGVSVDAEGVLNVKKFEDPTGQLRQQRLRAAQQALAGDLAAASKLRMVSLPRLERALAARLAEGNPPDEAMLYLAGIQRVQYVFFYPEANDLVLAGPAEGWMPDLAGRMVGLQDGRPMIELRDLVVALRAYRPGGARGLFVGCTIDPSREGLARLQEFQRSVPATVRPEQLQQVAQQMARGMHESLGQAEIRVFGISPRTHFAQVLIEADYRMKLIGLGLERPPIKLASYLDLLQGGTGGTLQRWWLTPDYECVRVTDDRLGMELVGQGVRLQTEDKTVGPDGRLVGTAKSNRASELFTLGFTRSYEKLAAASPVYAQLRNLVDLLIVASYIQQQDFARRAGWSMDLFLDEQRLAVETEQAPRNAPAAANAVIKGTRVLAAAGGGV